MNQQLGHKQINQHLEWLKDVIRKLDKHATIKQVAIAQDDTNIDAIIQINDETIVIECKTQVQPRNVEHIAQHLNEFAPHKNYMVIANYITPKAKELLTEKGIAYLDEGGNISMRLPKYVLHVEGLETKSEPEKYMFRAFTKTGVRVVFQLLANPELINVPQRELAKRAGVSLGTIPKVLKELLRDKFAVKITEQSYQLTNKEQLLQRWVDAFNTRLLPSLYTKTYTPRGMNAHEFFKAAKMNEETQWGGEAAAAIITNYLRPEKYSLYTNLMGGELMNHYKLVPSEEGEITVYEKFWEDEKFTTPYVHPIIAYAELIGSGDSRNLETAEMIINEHIRPKL